MKAKTTRGQMYRIYGKENIICLGYCVNQRLITRFAPLFYTSGVYGWNADIYDFGNFAICTGYRPFGNESKDLRNICDKYEKRLIKATPRGKGRVLNNFIKAVNNHLNGK